MTKLLEEAFLELNKLPEKEQNQFAQRIIDDLKWDKSYDESKNLLALMAKEALTEYKAGKTKSLDDL
jgi:hypothetical protein